MAEPYSVENGELAQDILGRAYDEMIAAGLDPVEAAHALIHQGLDLLPGLVCHEHLLEEYDAVIGACEMRLEWLQEATH
jgi:hypothetical protein